MISNEPLVEDRVHLNPQDVLPPIITGSAPVVLEPTKSELMLLRMTQHKEEKTWVKKLRGAIFPIGVVVSMVALIIMIFLYNRYLLGLIPKSDICRDQCKFHLILSSEDFQQVQELIDTAEGQVKIISKAPPDMSDNATIHKVNNLWVNSEAEVSILFANVHVSNSLLRYMRKDTGLEVEDNHMLSDSPVDEILPVMTQFISFNDKHLYLTNQADHSLVVKPYSTGLLVTDCPCVTEEVSKVFDVILEEGKYSLTESLGWTISYRIKYNISIPLKLIDENEQFVANIGFTNSLIWPHDFNKSNELQSVKELICRSKQWVYISIMKYIPAVNMTTHPTYWSNLDTYLRTVLFQSDLMLKILLYDREYGNIDSQSQYFLRSLAAAFGDKLHLKVIKQRPNEPEPLQFIVSDAYFYFGTPYWTGDYFAGKHLGLGIIGSDVENPRNTSISTRLKSYFDELWDSA